VSSRPSACRRSVAVLCLLLLLPALARAAEPGKPLRVLLIAGGCCHDYPVQTKLLEAGIEARLHAEVDVVLNPDKSTKATFEIYGNPDWDKGYDVVIHDECSADVTDPAYVGRILAAHRRGTPAVNLHCAMHSYRWGDFRQPVPAGADNSGWFEMLGLQSIGHGPQFPIAVAFTDRAHPITKPLADWRTINEELYNNIQVLPTAKVLATGKQLVPPKPKAGEAADPAAKPAEVTAAVVWTNEFGPNRTRIFSTSLGHNNDTVGDGRYLDLITRGLLWAAGRLGDDGSIPADLQRSTAAAPAAAGDWAAGVKLPPEEQARAVRLFNGRDTEGWEGHIDPYWSIDGGEIVGRNTEANAPQVSTYLLTKKPYRNLRLLLESKLVTSEMHSGVAIWGKKFDKDGEASSYQGHLVMFPSGYGLYDLYRRNGISGDQEGRAKAAGKQHDWNQLEILAIGSRIRLAVNGKEVLDWTDPKPELCEAGPIGLQLHSNKVPQEVRFRGLVLVENPQDVLVTASPTP